MYQANANPASSPPAINPATPTPFATAAPVLCWAGADEDAEVAAELTVLVAVLDALDDADDDADDEADRLDEGDVVADEDRDNVDEGRMIPEMVVAALKESVG